MVLSAGQPPIGGHLTNRSLFLLLGHHRPSSPVHESSLSGGLSLSNSFS